jgi:hypothetical protein
MKPRPMIFALAAIAWMPFVHQSRAQDCDSILNENLMNDSLVVNQESAAEAVASSYCRKSFQEAQSDGSLSLGGSYGLFSADGSASQSQYDSFKASNCGGMSSDQQAQRYYFNAERALGSSVVEAWRQCKLNSTGMACFIRPASGASRVIFSIRFKSPGTSQARVERAIIINGTNESSPELSSKLYVEGSLINGADDIFVRIEDTSQPVLLSVKAVYDNVSQSCAMDFWNKPIQKVIVTDEAPVDSADLDLAGQWCIKASEFGIRGKTSFTKDGAGFTEKQVDLPWLKGNEVQWTVSRNDTQLTMLAKVEVTDEFCTKWLEQVGSDGENLTCSGTLTRLYEVKTIEQLVPLAEIWDIEGIRPTQMGRLSGLERCD